MGVAKRLEMPMDGRGERWSQWTGEVVRGKFPLLEFIEGSENSAVFATEFAGVARGAYVIKLMKADAENGPEQQSRWEAAARLTHSNLINIRSTGRTRIGSAEFVYAVMQRGEFNLAQMLQERPLSADETEEMLRPLASVLEYLHGNGIVHGDLQPRAIMVIGDQLKVSADNLPRSSSAAAFHASDTYRAPETRLGDIGPAADIWALGVTLIEALTQAPPARDDAAGGRVKVPPSLPEMFEEIIRHCVVVDPKLRWTAADVSRRLGSQVQPERSLVQDAQVATLDQQPVATYVKAIAAEPVNATPSVERVPSAHDPVVEDLRTRLATSPTVEQPEKTKRYLLPLALLVVVAALVGLLPRLFRAKPAPNRTVEVTNSPVTQGSEPAQTNAPLAAVTPAANDEQTVVRQVLPNVAPSASATITGTIRVRVGVVVNAAGKVEQTTLVTPGPSRYFARLATAAAQQWEFTPRPAGQGGTTNWVLQFEFRRDSRNATPVRTRE